MSQDPRICEEYSGHDWQLAGGGMLICPACEGEKWADGPIKCPECEVAAGYEPVGPYRSACKNCDAVLKNEKLGI